MNSFQEYSLYAKMMLVHYLHMRLISNLTSDLPSFYIKVKVLLVIIRSILLNGHVSCHLVGLLHVSSLMLILETSDGGTCR